MSIRRPWQPAASSSASNEPMIVQFLDFLWSYCTFDFGISMWSGNPVSHEIAIACRCRSRSRSWRR